jgi:galactokinase
MNTTLLRKNFIETFGRDAESEEIFFAPGRVCLIGEHIDYNGGLVIPAAISLGIYAVARPNKSNTLHIKSTLDNKEFVFDLSKKIIFNPSYGWANYPLGMAKYFIQKGHTIYGCEILFTSTLPVGSGLSSSAAVEVLTGYILSQLNKIDIQKQELALAAKEVEYNFVGVQCGIMDQFAVAFGKENHAIKLNCTSLEYEYLPLYLSEYNLVIFNTNKKRELAESSFNTRVKECNDALQIIKQHENISCLADASLEAIEKYIEDEILYKIAYHVVSENLRVAKAAEVLKQNNIETFGKLLFESHDSLKNNYEVSGKELDTFIDFSKQHSGCLGAKMTGAGFGGCAVAIVKSNLIEDFTNNALGYYKKETGRGGEIYIAEISDGVKAINQ